MPRTISEAELAALLAHEVSDLVSDLDEAISGNTKEGVENALEELEKWSGNAASLMNLKPVQSLSRKVNAATARAARFLAPLHLIQPTLSDPIPNPAPPPVPTPTPTPEPEISPASKLILADPPQAEEIPEAISPETHPVRAEPPPPPTIETPQPPSEAQPLKPATQVQRKKI